MSKKLKKVLAIISGLVFGIFLTVYGAKECLHSRQLATRGKSTTGEVLETQDNVHGKLRSHTYYVRVKFQPEGGAIVQQNVSVDEDVFQAAQNSATARVFYLAEDPAICAVGETVKFQIGRASCRERVCVPV